MVIDSLKTGISLARKHLGLSLMLFAINLLFGLLLTVPLYRELTVQIGKSLVGKSLLVQFSYTWLAEFKYNNPSFLRTMGNIVLPVVICYIFLWSALSGGIIETFRPDGEGKWGERFSSGTRKHFFPFFRLTLFSSVTHLLTYWLVMIKLWSRVEDLIEESPYPQLEFATGLALSLTTILLVLFLDMIFDFARIKKVLDKFPSVLLATTGSVRFCFGNLSKTVVLYLLLLVLSGALIGAYLFAYSLIPQNRLGWIIALFILQEIFMLGRVFIRVIEYSSRITLYLRLTSKQA